MSFKTEKMKHLNRIVDKNNQNDGKILKEVTFDQFKDFIPIKNSVAVFSSEVYYKISSYIRNTMTDNKERGFFVFGKEIAKNVIIFTDYSSDFETFDYKTRDGGVKITNDSFNETLSAIRKDSKGNRKYDCVMHFHTHPNKRGLRGDQYSDQDLLMYCDLQKNALNNCRVDKEGIYFLGMLASPLGNNYRLSIVFYDENRKKIYRIKNMFYDNGNKKLARIDPMCINKNPTSFVDIKTLKKFIKYINN